MFITECLPNTSVNLCKKTITNEYLVNITTMSRFLEISHTMLVDWSQCLSESEFRLCDTK